MQIDANVSEADVGSVEDGQTVKAGEIIAETILSSEHGGQVRVPADLEVEPKAVGKETGKTTHIERFNFVAFTSTSRQHQDR